VMAMVDRAEYKRRQAPPGIKITTKAFGARPPDADHQSLRGLERLGRLSHRDGHARQRAQPALVVADLDVPHPRRSPPVGWACATAWIVPCVIGRRKLVWFERAHRELSLRYQTAAPVPSGREALGDRRIDAAVNEA